jgi:TldD protein
MTLIAAPEPQAGTEKLTSVPEPGLVERVLSRGGDFAELFWENRRASATSGDDGKVDRYVIGNEVGIGIRVDEGDHSLYVFTELVSEEGLLEAALEAASMMRNGATRSSCRALTARVSRTPHVVSVPIEAVPPKDRAGLVRLGHAVARSEDERIRHVSTYLSTMEQSMLTANSEGTYATDERIRLRYRVKAFAKNASGRRSMGIGGTAASCGFEQFDKEPAEKIARRAARQAVTLLEARPAPAGRMPVVLAAGTGGTIVHEAIGHNLEADAVLRGASVFSGMLGERLPCRELTVVDDATIPRALGSFGIDDEGKPAERTVLIDSGRLVGTLTDRTASRRGGLARTGNGRRSSFRQIALCRMTNTCLLASSTSRDEILAGTDRGLYVAALSGGSVNPVSGSLIFTAREAYLIQGGRLHEPVRGASVMGTALGVLTAIDAIGDDLDLWGGNCARSGQRVWTGFGMPTIRVAEMTVGGDSADV